MGYLDDLTPPASSDVRPDSVSPVTPTAFSDPPPAAPAAGSPNPYGQWSGSSRERNPYLYMQHDNSRYILALLVIVFALAGMCVYLYLSPRGTPVYTTTIAAGGGSAHNSTTTAKYATAIRGLKATLTENTIASRQLMVMNGSWQGGLAPFSIIVSTTSSSSVCQQTRRLVKITSNSNSFFYRFATPGNLTGYYCISVSGASTSGMENTIISDVPT